jgi:hypothetical protein
MLQQFVFGDELNRLPQKELHDLRVPANRCRSPEHAKFAPFEINLALARRIYRSTGPHEHPDRPSG